MKQPVNEQVEPPAPLLGHAAARIAFAIDARVLSDFAAALVPTRSDDLARPGEFITQARQVRKLSAFFVTRAVLLERARGNSWAEIAAAFGESEVWVRATWEGAETRWIAELGGGASAPETLDEALQLPPGEVPTEESDIRKAAEKLDDWCVRYVAAMTPHVIEVGETQRPVTDGIVEH